MQPGRCLCSCHSEHRANQREAMAEERYADAYDAAQQAALYEFKGQGASVTDAIEAVTACPDCLNDHCPALLGRVPRGPRIIRIRPPFNPHSDSQASGNTNSEGDE